MKRPNRILTSVIATGVLGIASQSALAQVIFNDTFNNGSTVQSSPITPTDHSTTYQWFQQGSAPTTPTIAANDLHLVGNSGTSSLAPLEAAFSASPITLTVGQSLNLSITFVDTTQIFNPGTDSTLNIGLFNSGGTLPNIGAQLNGTTYLTGGGSQNWNGYVARIRGAGNSTIFTRYLQSVNGTTSQNQDILFNGASGNSAYNSPAGATVATSGGQFTAGLTQGNTYTLSYTISMTGANTLTFNNNLFDSLNNTLFSQVGSLTSTTNVVSYDAFGFGWRFVNPTSASSAVDINSITVTLGTVAVPEPATVALTLTGFGLLFFVRRNRR
jgi:hypothetical protein